MLEWKEKKIIIFKILILYKLPQSISSFPSHSNLLTCRSLHLLILLAHCSPTAPACSSNLLTCRTCSTVTRQQLACRTYPPITRSLYLLVHRTCSSVTRPSLLLANHSSIALAFFFNEIIKIYFSFSLIFLYEMEVFVLSIKSYFICLILNVA